MLNNQRFILAVLLILIFAMAARTPLDSDMWWHLRIGEETVRIGRPVTVDILSHTRQGEPWVNHSWLFRVGLYSIFKVGGFFALGALVALLAAASFGFVYLQMDGSALLRAFIIIFAVPVAALVWSPRPQIVSLVFFGLAGYLLYLYKWRQRDYLWTLVPIFILWSNLHGGYGVGLLLIAAMVAGEMINRALFRDSAEILDWGRIGKLVLWGVIAGLVVVINPNGIAMWLIPFKTVDVSVLQASLTEWASPDFHQLVEQPFLWLLFATLGIASLSKRRMDGTDLVTTLGFAYLAFLFRRNFGTFAMVAAPVLSRHFYILLQDWQEQAEERFDGGYASIRAFLQRFSQGSFSPRVTKAINAVVIILLVIVALLKLYAVTEPTLVATFTEDFYPVKAVEWIKQNQPQGQIFNEYNWGGYLIWHLRDYPVFIDGRTDLYDDELLEEYLMILSGDDGWQEALGDRQVKVVLIKLGSGLDRQLSQSMEWERVFEEENAVVFVR